MDRKYELIDLRVPTLYLYFIETIFNESHYFMIKPMTNKNVFFLKELYGCIMDSTKYLFYCNETSFRVFYQIGRLESFLECIVEFYDEQDQLLFYNRGFDLTSRIRHDLYLELQKFTVDKKIDI